MKRLAILSALVAVLVFTIPVAPGAQYPYTHPCDSGPVYANWCDNGAQNLCTPFHVGPTYENPYGVQQMFDYSYWSDEFSAWMLRGHVLNEPSYEIDVYDGARQFPYCELPGSVILEGR